MTARAMACEAASYEWQVIPPAVHGAERPVILTELSEFRGRVLYANGRRPHFWNPGRGYSDDDPLDVHSFHITARAGNGLVGYMRVRPLPDYGQTSVGRLITPRRFADILGEMGLKANDCLEVGRWSVAPEARGTALGRTLVIGAWAIGRWLDKRRLVVTVGTRDGQAIMLTRLGGQFFPSCDPSYIAEYDDELAPMYFDLDRPPARVATQLESVTRLLKLPDR